MSSCKTLFDALLNREKGLESSIHFSRWCCSRFCRGSDLSFRSFKRHIKTNITCSDLEKNEYKYALIGYGNGFISIYDVGGYDNDAIFPAVATIDRSVSGVHEFSVDCIQWYPHDTGMFMSLSADKSLKVWDTNELEVAETFRFNHDVYSFHMSEKASKHSTVAVCCKDKNIYMCDLKSGSKVHTMKGHTGAVYAAKWSSRRDNILCSASSDGFVYMWDFRKVKSYLASFESKTIVPNARKSAHQGCVTGLCFSSNGLNLLSYGGDGLKLWDCVNMCDSEMIFDEVENTSRRTIQMGLTQNLMNDLICVPSGINVKLFDLVTGNDVHTLSGHFMDVSCCMYNPKSCELYTGSADGQILVWDYQSDMFRDESLVKDSWSDYDGNDNDTVR